MYFMLMSPSIRDCES